MQSSKLGYRAWALAIFLRNSQPKGISSVRLAQYVGITQASAWYMLHRIREAFPIGAAKLRGRNLCGRDAAGPRPREGVPALGRELSGARSRLWVRFNAMGR